jgi:hypothetical protein
MTLHFSGISSHVTKKKKKKEKRKKKKIGTVVALVTRVEFGLIQ